MVPMLSATRPPTWLFAPPVTAPVAYDWMMLGLNPLVVLRAGDVLFPAGWRPKLPPMSPPTMLLAPVLVTAPVAEEDVTEPAGPMSPSSPPMMLLPAAVTATLAVEFWMLPALTLAVEFWIVPEPSEGLLLNSM